MVSLTRGPLTHWRRLAAPGQLKFTAWLFSSSWGKRKILPQMFVWLSASNYYWPRPSPAPSANSDTWLALRLSRLKQRKRIFFSTLPGFTGFFLLNLSDFSRTPTTHSFHMNPTMWSATSWICRKKTVFLRYCVFTDVWYIFFSSFSPLKIFFLHI